MGSSLDTPIVIMGDLLAASKGGDGRDVLNEGDV
jgi:hypothetical protein